MHNRELSINNRKTNILLPLALFFAFAICSLVVLLFASTIYRKTLDSSVQNDAVNTALSYISEKIQNEEGAEALYLPDEEPAGILPDEITDAIVLCFVHNDASYYTYIYIYDGFLRELTFKEGSSVSPSTGTQLLSLSELNAERLSDDLIKISCSDENGNTGSQLISLHRN